MKSRDLSGQRFTRLLVLGRAENDQQGSAQFRVKCDCGMEKVVRGAYLRRGTTISCGCARGMSMPARNTTHGCATRGSGKRAEYRIWAGIIQRCTNPNLNAYPRYGGRGILVCDEWRDFSKFLASVGPRPSPRHSIDRYPDNDGHYEPGNVRWATPAQQNANRRRAPRKGGVPPSESAMRGDAAQESAS